MAKQRTGKDENTEIELSPKEHSIADVIGELRKNRPNERLIIDTMDKYGARDGSSVYDPLLPVLREQKESKPELVKELYFMLQRQHEKETAKDRLRAKNDAQRDR